jgi:hypothetical protein
MRSAELALELFAPTAREGLVDERFGPLPDAESLLSAVQWNLEFSALATEEVLRNSVPHASLGGFLVDRQPISALSARHALRTVDHEGQRFVPIWQLRVLSIDGGVEQLEWLHENFDGDLVTLSRWMLRLLPALENRSPLEALEANSVSDVRRLVLEVGQRLW